MTLNVPLIEQPQGSNKCGHACVMMVLEFFSNSSHSRTFDNSIFRRLEQDDGRLNSFGVCLALLEFAKQGYVFYATDSLGSINQDGQTNPLTEKDHTRVKGLKDSDRVFLMEWYKYSETTEDIVDNTFIVKKVESDQDSFSERFPSSQELLKYAVENFKVPCITPVSWDVISKVNSGGILHNLVVTDVGRDFVRVNNSGPVNPEKNQLITLDLFNKAWQKSDNDLIILFPGADKFKQFLLRILNHVLNENMGMYIMSIPGTFWESVIKILRDDKETENIIQKRIDMMNMQAGPTATLLRTVLERMNK